ncbi:hypothetical protein PSH03_005398 [Micromonospora sp. PSH03]|nr:hypothetical protein [Micromonospora salmantinae]MCG5459614.1 hypothetical protein [Micromonospora salmantinae]
MVFLCSDASVQFSGVRAMHFRVIRVLDWVTYDGWVWLDGYQLNASGDAIERRTVYVQIWGVRPSRLVPAERRTNRKTSRTPIPKRPVRM